MNGFDGASSPAPSSSSSNSTLRPLQLQNTNKYLQNKSWVCTHCHFANDSLKIVCMNCRASKQHPTQNGNQVTDMSTVAKMHHSVQTKRKMMIATSNGHSSRTIQATSKDSAVVNRSNEENECGPAEKSSKMVKTESTSTQFCKNCKGCDAANKTEKPQPMSNETNCMASLVTPTPQKPLSLFEMVIRRDFFND